jgi:hypothetical protein
MMKEEVHLLANRGYSGPEKATYGEVLSTKTLEMLMTRIGVIIS